MAVPKTTLLNGQDLKRKCSSVVRICLPGIISFFCICLFLFLSIMIIEGYSISEMMQK
jgi:hypothetical protein